MELNHKINPFYTDLYQFTSSYAYFLAGKHNQQATFQCFFRKYPFKGEYTILAGIKQAIAFIQGFKITEVETKYLKEKFPHLKEEYLTWLQGLNASQLIIDSFKEGDMVFASEPIITLTGPLAFCQILETPLLNLIGFATLVSTNASRMVTAAKGKQCIQFGIRRAQGPDGGLTASQYSFLGGFSGTSNVECGRLFHIPTFGTMSHAYITSFRSLDDAEEFQLNGIKIKETTLKWRKQLGFQKTHDGELAAFLMYAHAFPDQVMTLIDTYSTIDSGLPNSIAVFAALSQSGHNNFGFRLDSGDLKDYAKKCRDLWKKAFPFKNKVRILASNDLNQQSIAEMEKTQCQIDTYAVGTNIATCQKQPALGLVYKLVEYKHHLTMKFSEEKEKITLPGRKNVFRVWVEGHDEASFDLITLKNQEPKEGDNIIVLAQNNPLARYQVTIKKIRKMNNQVLHLGKLTANLHNLHEAREYSVHQRKQLNKDIFKLQKPAKHSVYLSLDYYKIFQKTIQSNICLRNLE